MIHVPIIVHAHSIEGSRQPRVFGPVTLFIYFILEFVFASRAVGVRDFLSPRTTDLAENWRKGLRLLAGIRQQLSRCPRFLLLYLGASCSSVHGRPARFSVFCFGLAYRAGNFISLTGHAKAAALHCIIHTHRRLLPRRFAFCFSENLVVRSIEETRAVRGDVKHSLSPVLKKRSICMKVSFRLFWFVFQVFEGGGVGGFVLDSSTA